MGFILGLIAAFVVGAAMVEMGFTEPDFELPSRIFSIVCGIIMMLPGLIVVPPAWADYRKKKKEQEEEEKKGAKEKRKILGFLKMQEKVLITEEKSARGQSITAFRESFRQFFLAKYIAENSALQNDVTQLYWNILALQKRKLEKKNVCMEFTSKRIRYGAYPDHTERTYSDGKYEISEVTETLEARKVFYKDGRRIGSEKCSRLANVILVDPKTDKKERVYCLNCGAETTREQLLDGCDYCGTRYSVEDLDEKVSGFSFGHDYDLAYSQYQDARSRFSLWVSLLVGIPIGIFSLIGGIGAVMEGASESNGPIMTLAAVLITVAFVTFSAILLSLVFFYFFIFPGIQILASFLHLVGVNLEALKKAKETDPKIEAGIREEDPLFSRTGFYAHLQNMLATVYMGLSDDEILAFSEGEEAEKEILSQRHIFEDVINVSTNWMRIVSYGMDKGMSQMIVEGYLTLTKERNGRLKREKRHIRLQVSREADCRTKVVAGPSFYRCKGCGRAMNILSGKKCEYCGRVRNMTSMDWTLTHFKIYG